MVDKDQQGFASATYQVQCSALCKDGLVMLRGRPCKIVQKSVSYPGKCGHPKVYLVGIDIFTGEKLEDVVLVTHNMDVPNVSIAKYQLINIDDGFLNVISKDGSTKDDVKVPEGELGGKLSSEFKEGKELVVSVMTVMGEEACVSYQEALKEEI